MHPVILSATMNVQSRASCFDRNIELVGKIYFREPLMKILSVSDYVVPDLLDASNPVRLEGVELILGCGDLPPEYLTALKAKLNAPLYYVKGNHDIRYESSPPGGCMNLDMKIIQTGRLNILGFEGSRWYNGGPNQYTENDMRRRLWSLRPRLWWSGGVDIVITHAPPRHIHDAEDPCHKGFHSFRWFIDRYSPRCFIHGHIHKIFADESERISVINRTKVINTYGYYLFEVPAEQAEI